jgi:acetyltransferase-like isoleucine patch superfamily enzyme
MRNEEKEEVIFKNGVMPYKKNRFIQSLLFLKYPLLLPGVKWLIKKYLKNCSDIYILPGLYFNFGNIYAKGVSLGDTLFVDWAPISIGRGTILAGRCMLITTFHRGEDVVARPINIGKNCSVYAGTIIIGGVNIGDNCVIGAGSVVTKDIPPNCFAAGNPAKIIRYLQ